MDKRKVQKRKLRQIRIIGYLLEQTRPLPISFVAKEVGVNPNTLKKDIPQIERFLEGYKIKLNRKPGVGVWLQGSKKAFENARKALMQSQKHYSFYDLKAYFIKTFLTKDRYPTVEDLCDALNISRPTALKYVSAARKWLAKFNIKLIGKPGVGYQLTYKEDDLRNALSEFIDSFEKDKIKELMAKIYSKSNSRKICFEALGHVDFSPIIKFINKLETVTNTNLTDKDYVIFALKIAIAIGRIKHKHIIFYESKRLLDVMQNSAYKAVCSSLPILEAAFDVKFLPEEAAYITLTFISSKVQETSMLGAEENKKNKIYTEFAKEIAAVADEIFGLPVAKDSEFIHMLALHLKSTLNKIKYGLKIKNPLLEEIKEEYPISFDIAQKVSIILGKKMGIVIPEEESGYIAMYIATAVEKLKHRKSKRKKVAVVCAMAMGTSSLLFWRLVNEMPDIDVVQVGSYKDIIEGKISNDIDLIISTIPLPSLKVPHVVVSPFLGSRERRKIREMLGITRQKIPYPSSKEFEEIIQRSVVIANLKANNAEKAISTLAEALFRKGAVKNGFIDSVIKREEEFPTGLNTPIPIALPHTEIKYSKREAFAIATLKKPVIFKEMGNPRNKINVRIILMPVLTKESTRSAVFYDLLRKCRDRNIAPRLIAAENDAEMISILEKPLTN